MEIWKIILKILRVILIIFFLITGYFYFMQEKYIYFPQKITRKYADAVVKNNKYAEEIEIDTQRGKIYGWYIRNKSNLNTPVVIYFGGNAEEVSYLVNENRFEECSIITFNYRGYGLSEGTPNEKDILIDSVIIYDNIIKKYNIDKNNVIIMGRSLGTGVATYLSNQRPCKAVILTSPYDSMTSVAQEKMPFLPVGIINRNRYENLNLADKIKVPLFILVGKEDTTIPNWHSKKLFDSWGGKKKYREIEKEDHNTIIESNLYWKAVNDFIKDEKDKI